MSLYLNLGRPRFLWPDTRQLKYSHINTKISKDIIYQNTNLIVLILL